MDITLSNHTGPPPTLYPPILHGLKTKKTFLNNEKVVVPGGRNMEYFRDTDTIDEALKKAADVAIKDVLGVKEGEKVLIITNPPGDAKKISEALYDSCLDAGADPALIFQPVKTQLDFAEPSVIGALRMNPDVAISISHQKLGKDPFAMKEPIVVGEKRYNHVFNYLLGEKKMRSFWSPTITVPMFVETVPIDYKQLRDDCERVKKVLDWADEVHITAPSGTDITIGVKNREAMKDDGNFTFPGAGGNLPAGEVFISPALGTSHGVIAYDGSISSDRGEIIIREPIICEVADNHVVSIKGGEEAARLSETIKRAEQKPFEMAKEGQITQKDAEEYSRNARNLGELGIGLNRKARIVGNMLEDEKVYGTCHIAIGSNYDEDAEALIHLDGLIKNPTIVAIKGREERKIMVDGKLVV